jgi:NTE family protein
VKARAAATPSSRLEGCHCVSLVLQGGGALGSYQAGVYEALEEAGLHPDWLAGVSIGAINSALIAGNPPGRRLERLRSFWERVTARGVWPVPMPDGDDWRRARNLQSAFSALLLGQPGFFRPNVPGPWFTPRGAPGATSFYDTTPLRETLEELVDWPLLNGGYPRLAFGAVSVETGNLAWFDSAKIEIGPEHVMASAALPPGLPPVQVGTDWFWDGGLVSNTPLQYLLEQEERDGLVVQVDLFPARGPLPRDLEEVLGREKDIRYSSRTRLNTDAFTRLRRWQLLLKHALTKVPEEQRDEEERRLIDRLERMPRLLILQLIHERKAYEGLARDYEFGPESMKERWQSGLEDMRATLRRPTWLRMPEEDPGIAVHDVHRQPA